MWLPSCPLWDELWASSRPQGRGFHLLLELPTPKPLVFYTTRNSSIRAQLQPWLSSPNDHHIKLSCLQHAQMCVSKVAGHHKDSSVVWGGLLCIGTKDAGSTWWFQAKFPLPPSCSHPRQSKTPTQAWTGCGYVSDEENLMSQWVNKILENSHWSCPPYP